MSLPVNTPRIQREASVGKVAGSANSGKLQILTVHPLLKHLKNMFWADVSFVRECFNKACSFAVLPLCFAKQVVTQSGTFLSVGQAPKTRILYWKPELSYTTTLHKAFQKNKKVVKVRQ